MEAYMNGFTNNETYWDITKRLYPEMFEKGYIFQQNVREKEVDDSVRIESMRKYHMDGTKYYPVGRVKIVDIIIAKDLKAYSNVGTHLYNDCPVFGKFEVIDDTK